MDPFPFDDTSTDALLDGKVTPARAPDGLQHVAALIHLAQAPATSTDRAAERQVVSQMGVIVRGEGSGAAATSRFAAHRARFAAVAAVAGLVALSGGAVAAAAGALPNPVQRVVASGFSNVGISMPTPTTHARPTTTLGPPTTTHHPAATLAGLCVAYRAASRNPIAAAHQAQATAFVRLAEAATAHHESVAAYCTQVLAARKPAHHGAPPTTVRPPTSVPGKGKGKGKGIGNGNGKPDDPAGTHHPSSGPPPGKGPDSSGSHGPGTSGPGHSGAPGHTHGSDSSGSHGSGSSGHH